MACSSEVNGLDESVARALSDPLLALLAAGLLVAAADLDHPVTGRCLGVLGLGTFPGLAELLGG
jgi:hypothetical protein